MIYCVITSNAVPSKRLPNWWHDISTSSIPRSGMILRAETEILISPDGSVDELFGTAPDVRLPSAGRSASITQDDLLKDEWIKPVMTKL